MFPNFFFGGSAIPVTYLGMSEVYGNYDANNPTTLTMPSNSKVGDFLLLLVRTATISTYIMHADMRAAIAAAGWIAPAQWFDSATTDSCALINSFGFNNLRIFYKFKESSDDAGLIVKTSDTSALSRISATIYAYENVHPTVPFLGTFTFGHNNTFEDGSGIEFRFHNRLNKIVLLHGQATNDPATEIDLDALSPAPVARAAATIDASLPHKLDMLVFGPDPDNQFEDLVPAGNTLTDQLGWTFVGSTECRYDVDSNGTLSYGLKNDTSTGRHHAEQTVDGVIAGESYLFAATCSVGTTGEMFLSVEIDGVEYGFASTPLSNQSPPSAGSVPTGLTEPTEYGLTPIGSITVSGTAAAMYMYMRFTAPASGSAVLRIGRTDDSGNLAYTGAVTQIVRWMEFAFGRMKGTHVPSYVDHGVAADGLYPMVCAGPNFPMSSANTSATFRYHFGFELMHRTADIPVDKLNYFSIPSRHDTFLRLNKDDPDGLSEIYDVSSGDDPTWPYSNNARLGHATLVPYYPPALDPAAPAKVYFECTYGTFHNTTSSKADASIGIAPAWCIPATIKQNENSQWPTSVTTVGSTRLSSLFLNLSGDVLSEASGTEVGLTADIVSGDVVGFSFDATDGTAVVYKNGSAVKTTTLSKTDIPYLIFLMKSIDFTLYFDRTLNLTGPFTYLPVGYSAWDWRNEV